MAEYVRNVRVLVEVNTNKTTYHLTLVDTALDEIEDAVREFIEGMDL